MDKVVKSSGILFAHKISWSEGSILWEQQCFTGHNVWYTGVFVVVLQLIPVTSYILYQFWPHCIFWHYHL